MLDEEEDESPEVTDPSLSRLRTHLSQLHHMLLPAVPGVGPCTGGWGLEAEAGGWRANVQKLVVQAVWVRKDVSVALREFDSFAAGMESERALPSARRAACACMIAISWVEELDLFTHQHHHFREPGGTITFSTRTISEGIAGPQSSGR